MASEQNNTWRSGGADDVPASSTPVRKGPVPSWSPPSGVQPTTPSPKGRRTFATEDAFTEQTPAAMEQPIGQHLLFFVPDSQPLPADAFAAGPMSTTPGHHQQQQQPAAGVIDLGRAYHATRTCSPASVVGNRPAMALRPDSHVPIVPFPGRGRIISLQLCEIPTSAVVAAGAGPIAIRNTSSQYVVQMQPASGQSSPWVQLSGSPFDAAAHQVGGESLGDGHTEIAAVVAPESDTLAEDMQLKPKDGDDRAEESYHADESGVDGELDPQDREGHDSHDTTLADDGADDTTEQLRTDAQDGDDVDESRETGSDDVNGQCDGATVMLGPIPSSQEQRSRSISPQQSMLKNLAGVKGFSDQMGGQMEKVAERLAELENAEEQNAGLKEIVELLKGAMKDMRLTHKNMEQRYARTEEMAVRLQGEVDWLKKEKVECEDRFEKEKAELEDTLSIRIEQLAKQDSKMAALEQEIGVLGGKTPEAKVRDELREAVDVLEAKNASLEDLNGQLGVFNDALTIEVAERRDEIRALADQVKALQSEVAVLDRRNQQLALRNDSLHVKLSDSSNRLKHARGTVRGLFADHGKDKRRIELKDGDSSSSKAEKQPVDSETVSERADASAGSESPSHDPKGNFKAYYKL